jgi:hypothetical protein
VVKHVSEKQSARRYRELPAQSQNARVAAQRDARLGSADSERQAGKVMQDAASYQSMLDRPHHTAERGELKPAAPVPTFERIHGATALSGGGTGWKAGLQARMPVPRKTPRITGYFFLSSMI